MWKDKRTAPLGNSDLMQDCASLDLFLPLPWIIWRLKTILNAHCLVGYSPWGHKESDTTEQLHFLSFYSSFWRRKWQPTPVFLPGESHGWRGLVDCSLWGCRELDATKQLTHTHIEFVTILFLFYVLFFCSWGMWDLRSLTRYQTCTPCTGRRGLNHWTAREVPSLVIKEMLIPIYLQSDFHLSYNCTTQNLLISLICRK